MKDWPKVNQICKLLHSQILFWYIIWLSNLNQIAICIAPTYKCTQQLYSTIQSYNTYLLSLLYSYYLLRETEIFLSNPIISFFCTTLDISTISGLFSLGHDLSYSNSALIQDLMSYNMNYKYWNIFIQYTI